MTDRMRINVTGIVQGVGFRPFIFNLAKSLGLNGYVLNSSEGVVIDIEGDDVTDFVDRMQISLPPLSEIKSLKAELLQPVGYTDFIIKESLIEEGRFTLISPDVSICPVCLNELFNPKDRRYLYPFTNCTNCGPRYTIIQDIPYDRPKTTMAKFTMCVTCSVEYYDPTNRRFHAQPNACPDCGPSITFVKKNGEILFEKKEAMESAIIALKDGAIVAIKGLGGFHLACDAANDEAVKRLRDKKRKSNKPFGLMSANTDIVKAFCMVSEADERALSSKERPILLMDKLPISNISEAVSPCNNYLGVMMPYTPLHYLLFYLPPAGQSFSMPNFEALVMTSGNLSEEPIVIDNSEAVERLSDIADYFLLHNRDIYMRVDDSVVRNFKDKARLIRRARGYVPFPIDLGWKMPEVLACGGELKNTLCLTKERYAIMSQHIGDMKNYDVLSFFEEILNNLKRSFKVEPKIIAYDMHPEYLSTKYALGQDGMEGIAVQHHHAHIASCMAENGIDEKVIGIAFDGTGYGADGNIWGGEFLIADLNNFERAGHFQYTPMPGGDKAIKEPWRMAVSYLYKVLGDKKEVINVLKTRENGLDRISENDIDVIVKMIEKGINSPLTSSAGRLFDAVSSIIGIKDKITFEGEAAIEMEMKAERKCTGIYSYEINSENNIMLIDASLIIAGLHKDIFLKMPQSLISAKFHNTMAEIILDVCAKIREESGLNITALSGGVFQNMLLLEKSVKKLEDKGFKVITHSKVPANDGGISLGQAVIAARRASLK
jgi:hydrogenase maturation protein HypF